MRKIQFRYVPITFVILFIALTISWFFSSELFGILTMDYNASDLIGEKNEIQSAYIYQILTWESLVDSSMFYIINFLPLLVVLPTLSLFDEKKLFFKMAKHKLSNLDKKITITVLKYSLISAVTVSSVFTLFYSIGGLFVHRSIEDIGGFASLFPTDFYPNHPYLFFIIMVWTIYFASSFVLSFISSSIILIVENEYTVLASILFLCMGLSLLSNVVNIPYLNIYDAYVAFNTTNQTHETFYPVIAFFMIGVGIFIYGKNKLKKYY